MKHFSWIIMVLLLGACGSGTQKTDEAKKDSLVTARDVAIEKKNRAEALKDSLTQEVEKLQKEEHELTAWVIEHATELSDDAPEVSQLNAMRKQLITLKNQLGLADGQVKLLEKKLKGKE